MPRAASDRASGFVVPPEDPGLDPRQYPQNLEFVIQGIEKKLGREYRGKDQRERYRSQRQDFFSKHGTLYQSYLQQIKQYCDAHPEECEDTFQKIPVAQPGNPLAQEKIGVKPEVLRKIGILPPEEKEVERDPRLARRPLTMVPPR